jgi:hypothetical protein
MKPSPVRKRTPSPKGEGKYGSDRKTEHKTKLKWQDKKE